MVKRYGSNGFEPGTIEVECGDLVHYDDYKALLAENERMRKALEALRRARRTAMEQTIKARIPECAEFAGIAQDLDFVVAALEQENPND